MTGYRKMPLKNTPHAIRSFLPLFVGYILNFLSLARPVWEIAGKASASAVAALSLVSLTPRLKFKRKTRLSLSSLRPFSLQLHPNDIFRPSVRSLSLLPSPYVSVLLRRSLWSQPLLFRYGI